MTKHNHSYTAEVNMDKKTNIAEIKGELGAKEFSSFVAEALKNLQKEAHVAGFRKGKVPEKMLIEKIGMTAVLEEGAELALAHLYPHIIEDKKLDVVGRPHIGLTKLAENNPLGFTISVSVMPEIKNLEYKKIASKKNSEKIKTEEVTEKEIAEVVKELKGVHARRNIKEGEKIDDKTIDAIELTDELVKTFGEFLNVEDFKNKIRENLGKEKEHKASEKKRLELFEELLSNTDIATPVPLIEAEKERMLNQFKGDVERMGVTWADYVKHVKKSEEEMKKDWEADASKRAKLEIILDHIAKEEKVTPTEEKIKEEVGHLMSHYKDLEVHTARHYVSGILARQATIDFLESLK
jgi:FKBP-type peptidyl-prolyl cis-trans isomerase (trigger factor)